MIFLLIGNCVLRNLGGGSVVFLFLCYINSGNSMDLDSIKWRYTQVGSWTCGFWPEFLWIYMRI